MRATLLKINSLAGNFQKNFQIFSFLIYRTAICKDICHCFYIQLITNFSTYFEIYLKVLQKDCHFPNHFCDFIFFNFVAKLKLGMLKKRKEILVLYLMILQRRI